MKDVHRLWLLRDRQGAQTADQSRGPDESSAVALSSAEEVSDTQAVLHIMTSSVLAAGSESVS